jgi:hypothetical protein
LEACLALQSLEIGQEKQRRKDVFQGAFPLRWFGYRPEQLSSALVHDEQVIVQHIREGRFQRSLSLVTAFASLLSGLEVTYEHYVGSYSQQIMYTPVILSAGLLITSIWAVFNRWAARILMPIVSLLNVIDGLIGFFLHIRGVQRKPGGWRLPVVNVVMGPPLMAPLLFISSGFLGLIATFLRREEDLTPPLLKNKGQPWRSIWLDILPQEITRELSTIEQDIREGRFQRLMGIATAISGFFSGFESVYSHYKNNFKYRMEWTPVVLTPVVVIAGIGTVWSRTIARTLLPITSALALIDGTIGFFYHIRGILRRPGGRKHLVYNVLHGPPIFAPLLFASTGFLGLLASLLRREKR